MPYHFNESKDEATQEILSVSQVWKNPSTHKYDHAFPPSTSAYLAPGACKEGIMMGELASYHTKKECVKVLATSLVELINSSHDP
jgi:hypothetical protein